MFSPISVKFVKLQENRPGYEYAELHTDHFNWRTGLVSFEVIHGLSRVVDLLPDKLATNRRIFDIDPGNRNPGNRHDHGFLVQLVIDLLSHFRDKQRSRGEIQRGQPTLSTIVTIADEDDGIESDHVDEVKLDLEGTLDKLATDLADVKQLTQVAESEQYWDRALAVIESADRIRESCKVYLEFVHPFLVETRRLVDENEIVESIVPLIRNRLSRSRNRLAKAITATKLRYEREG